MKADDAKSLRELEKENQRLKKSVAGVNGHGDLPGSGHDNSPRTATAMPQGQRASPGTATVPVLVQARGTTPLPAMASAKRTD